MTNPIQAAYDEGYEDGYQDGKHEDALQKLLLAMLKKYYEDNENETV